MKILTFSKNLHNGLVFSMNTKYIGRYTLTDAYLEPFELIHEIYPGVDLKISKCYFQVIAYKPESLQDYHL